MRKIAENYKLPYFTLSPTYSVCKNDGYLAGEHFTCPKCGQPAEVYSRITGYYRPVQNWNDGKVEEYRERKLYDTAGSCLKKKPAGSVSAEAQPAAEPAGKTDKIYLFTTKTCPNCRLAKSILDRAGVAYQAIDAEEHQKLVENYGIRQAPTLIVDRCGKVECFSNASNIRKYTEAL